MREGQYNDETLRIDSTKIAFKISKKTIKNL